MKKLLHRWAIAAAGLAAAFAFSSCVYDPYTTAGGSYSTDYGAGYGYGGSNFSTSMFVSTGNSRWGYDPYSYSYYDYQRRCFYDPYLNGYYPMGYRPQVVVGCPHPSGYRRNYCPPPRYVSHNTLHNYNNRVDQYRNSHYGWAKQVRPYGNAPAGAYDSHKSRKSTNQTWGNFTQPNYSTRSGGYSGAYSTQPTRNYSAGSHDSYYGGNKKKSARVPSAYNTPIAQSHSRSDQFVQPKSYRNTQGQSFTRPNNAGGGRYNPQPQQDYRRGNGKGKGRKEENRGYRSLGQG